MKSRLLGAVGVLAVVSSIAVALTAQAPAPPAFEVAVADVRPLIRKLSHGVFNDSGPGRREGTARERVVRILKWFRDDVPI
jgi:hypothetical protein